MPTLGRKRLTSKQTLYACCPQQSPKKLKTKYESISS